MNPKGVLFSIEEFAVFDGPGIRTAVFFKGCPLRCNWCHNPEGLEARRQLVRSPNGCLHCGKCREVCPHPNACVACGTCESVCPKHLLRISGEEYEAGQLAEKLLKNADILSSSGGGVTFSGGECLMQADFLTDVAKRLYGKVHLAIQTSGYGDGEKFGELLKIINLVMFDLKIMDAEAFRKYVKGDVAVVLENFERLAQSGKEFIVRVPLIPGVTDTEENLTAIAEHVKNRLRLLCVELLPYNKMAGGKYKMVGKRFEPEFDPDRPPNINTAIFESRGVPVKVY